MIIQRNTYNRIFVTTDTHFGHKNMQVYCGRPQGFEELILTGIKELTLGPQDLLIHLGDVAFGGAENVKAWHRRSREASVPAQTILILGNHDRSKTWHQEHWSWVTKEVVLAMPDGMQILLSHKPQSDFVGCSFNLHGHEHNKFSIEWQYSPKHILHSLEYYGYRPLPIEFFVEKWKSLC